jgi:hypothetical protein
MKKLEKFIYSVNYLPQILYFGSSSLILLIIIFDIEFIPVIPIFIVFFYMTYLAIKNYKKSDSNEIDGFEKLIYSVKYLPQTLYFSTLAWLIYTMYYAVYLDESVKVFGFEWSSPFEEIFLFWFLYITHLAVKNYKSEDKYGIKK